jgi:hypothetical protein
VTVILKHVIHDWDDERALPILANCRRAVPPDGALRLVEWILWEGNDPSVGKRTDVVMLIMTAGKERAIEEFRQLLANAGFRLNSIIPTSYEVSIIEALPS